MSILYVYAKKSLSFCLSSRYGLFQFKVSIRSKGFKIAGLSITGFPDRWLRGTSTLRGLSTLRGYATATPGQQRRRRCCCCCVILDRHKRSPSACSVRLNKPYNTIPTYRVLRYLANKRSLEIFQHFSVMHPLIFTFQSKN